MTNHPQRQLIDRYYDGQIDRTEWDRLFPHLRGCDSCRAHFDRVRAEHVERSGGTDEGGLTELEVETSVRVLQQFMREEGAKVRQPKPTRLAWTWGLALGLGAAVAVFLVVRAPDAGPGGGTVPDQPPVQSMGADWDPAGSIKTACVSKSGKRVVKERPVRCRVGERFALKVLASPDRDVGWATLVAVDSAFTPTVDSQRLAQSEDALVGPKLQPEAAYRVFVVWSEQALTENAIGTALAQLRAKATPLSLAGVLPVEAARAQIALSVEASDDPTGGP